MQEDTRLLINVKLVLPSLARSAHQVDTHAQVAHTVEPRRTRRIARREAGMPLLSSPRSARRGILTRVAQAGTIEPAPPLVRWEAASSALSRW